MGTLGRRILSAVLAAVILLGSGLFCASGAETEGKALKIAILDGLTGSGSAPYDAAALAELFASAGHDAAVITEKELAVRELFSAELYDLLMVPTGSAFPYSGVDNFKKYLREGGKLITSGGFAFSDLVYPETVGGSLGSAGMIKSGSVSQSPCLYVSIPASKFKQGVKYTLTLDTKTENIQTEKGLAHNSVYIYGNDGSLLSWKDFVALTSGSSDWDRKNYTFNVPSNANRVEIRLGLYITSGTIYFDNVRLSGDDGSAVFFDDMEKGIGGWLRTVSGNQVEYGTSEGVFTSNDRVVELRSDKVGDSGCRYDITRAIAGKSAVTVGFTCNYAIGAGKVGARVVFGTEGGDTVCELFSDTVSASWHGHSVNVECPGSFENAYLEFYYEKSSGRFIIDEISVVSGGETLFAEHNGELDRETFGSASCVTSPRENEKAYLASNDPESVGDLLFYTDSHVPLFDSETKFNNAVRLAAADAQSVFKGEALADPAGISGYSAITWVGNNRGRYQPLLYAYDTYGRKVGVAAAMFRVFYSPSDYGKNGGIKYWNDYAGTDIGFFGVTDRDLFAPGNDKLREGLLRMAELLCGKTYICSAASSYDCYRQGELVMINTIVENGDSKLSECDVTLTVTAEDTGDVVFTATETAKVPAHTRRTARFRLKDIELTDDFYYFRVTLSLGGDIIDVYDSGFVVWNDEVVANGPKYTYHDNYIHIVQPDGTEKAVFLSGVDDGGNSFVNEDQTPLVWKNDFARRRDAGVLLYENLQQYRGYGDFAMVFENGYPTEKHMRSVDCTVYLAQKYGQIYMMGMLLGANIAVSDAQLETDKEYISKMAARYKDVPGVIYYLNGDLVVKPSSDINALYREFLKERYGSDENLNAARRDLKSIENAAYDQSYAFGGGGWADIKAYDQNLFRTTLIKRWANALTAAAKEAGGKDKAVLCEFFSWPMDSIDVPLSIGDLTYSNSGFFDKIENLTEMLAGYDQRYRGKSFGIGESNKRTHPDFGETYDYYASGSARYAEAYMRAAYYNTLGMGGNHYQVWCFKDETKYSFPWGLTYMDTAGERNTFNLYRSMNIISAGIEPEYREPEIAFITPDTLRMSGSRGWYVGHYATLRGLDLAQETLADNILTLNECDLVIPESVKVIFYPMAFTVPDNVYETLTEFVNNGGTLYISGDPAYDLNTRKRVYGDRAERLTGVKVTKVIYAGVDDEGADIDMITDAGKRVSKPCVKIELNGAEAVYNDAEGGPVFTVYSLGAGKVFYSTVPVEIVSNDSTHAADASLYIKTLEGAGIVYDAVKGSATGLRTSVLYLKDGGSLRVISNSSNVDIKTEYKTGGDVYSFRLGGWQTAVFIENASGELVTADVPVSIQKNGEKFTINDCGAALVPLDGGSVQNTRLAAILPASDGSFAYYCDKWQSPVAVRGTVYYGEFLRASDAEASYKGGRLSVDGIKEGDIVVVCEAGEEEKAVNSILGLLGIAGKGSSQQEPETSVAEPASAEESSAPEQSSGGSGLIIAVAAAAAVVIAAAAAVIIKKRSGKGKGK